MANLSATRWWRSAGARVRAARWHILVVLVACALSFGLRCYYVFVAIDADNAFQQIGGDGEDFLRIAYTLAQTDTFAEPLQVNVKDSLLHAQHPRIRAATDVQPTAWRPPLWPFVLAGTMRLTNYDLSAMFYLRFALDALTLGLFYLLLRKLPLRPGSRGVALLLLALHPAWLIYSGTLFSEPLTLLVHIAFALSLLYALDDSHSRARLIVAGSLAGLVILAHPFYLCFPFIALALCYRARLVKLGGALLVVALLCAVVAPWIVRNMLLFHTHRPVLTTSAGINLAKGWNQAFLGLYRNTTADVALSEQVIGAEAIKESGLSEEEKSEAYAQRAGRFAETNWRLIPAIAARKLTGALDPIPETTRGGVLEMGRAAFQIISFGPLLFVLWARRAGRLQLFARALVAAYLLMSVLTMGTIRYRFPLIWVELLSTIWVAEYGCGQLARWWAGTRAGAGPTAAVAWPQTGQ